MYGRLVLLLFAVLILLHGSLILAKTWDVIAVQNPPLTAYNVSLVGGTIISPHLNDWQFDGIDDYVDFTTLKNWIRKTMTIETMFYLSGYSTSQAHSFITRPSGGTAGNPYMYFAIHWYERQIQFAVYNGSSLVSLGKNNILQTAWFEVKGIYVNGLEELWINNTRYGSSTAVVITNEKTDYGLLIGYKGWWGSDNYFFNGKIAFIKITNENTTNKPIQIINKPISLIDASFFDGSYYYDLINNSVVGTPYGGVERVPAEQKWLWVVFNGTNDGQVHLKYMPNGTWVKIVNATNNVLLDSFTVNGTVNNAGLVEDYVYSPTWNTSWPVNIYVYPPETPRYIYVDIPQGIDTDVKLYNYQTQEWNTYSITNPTIFIVPNNTDYLITVLPSEEKYGGATEIINHTTTNGDVVINLTTNRFENLDQFSSTDKPYTLLFDWLNQYTYGWGLLLVHIGVLAAILVWQGPVIAGATSIMLTTILYQIARQVGIEVPLLTMVIALSISGTAIGLAVISGTRER